MARRLEDLDLTGEEAERLGAAFRDERFRRLFAEYVAELADPAQRAVYEAEVAALERQRGVEARFLHPQPGWALRTSQAGARRCYVNICSHPLVGRPQARPEPGGSRWTLPHCLAPGREELLPGRQGRRRRLLYDVLFHPEALRLAARSARFRRLVDDTALEALEARFAPGLDRANAVPLRGVRYKGAPQATLLRTPLPGGAPPPSREEEEEAGGCPLPPFPSPYAYPPPAPQTDARPPPAPAAAGPTTPRWTLQHRCYVDLQDYRCSRDSAPSPVPRELVVTIELPLLSSAAQAQLEIRGQELQLDSRRPAAYRLRLPLPYPVDESRGKAAFHKAQRQLLVTLPVVPRPPPPPPGPTASQEHGTAPAEPQQLLPPPSSEGSEPSLAPAAAADAEHEQAPLVPHVGGVGSVELPVCAEEGVRATPAASPGSSPDVPLCLLAGSGHVRSNRGSPAPTGRAETVQAGCSALPSESHGNPQPEGLPCAAATGGSDGESAPLRGCEDASSVGLVPAVGFDSPVELPVHPSTSCPAAPPSLARLSPDMDLNPCPSVPPSAVPPPCLRGTVIPPAHPSGLGTIPANQSCSSVDHPSAELSAGHNLPECPRGNSGSNGHLLDLAAGVGAISSHVDLSVPALECPRNWLPATGPDTGTAAVEDPASCPEPARPAPLRCPPFHCSQDEESLTLLLQVPGILPQSLHGEVGPHHYRARFSDKEAAPYTFLLKLSPENQLTPPERRINVSLTNAVIGLTKSPETTGLWTKLYFGLDCDTLQERLFVTEDNVAGFLSSPPDASCSNRGEVEVQPLIEVLSISEGKSEIRLKAQEQNKCELGPGEESVHPRGMDDGAPEDGSELPAESRSLQCQGASGSLTAMRTMGGGSDHCLELDPASPTLATAGKQQFSKCQESPLACTTGRRATSATEAPLAGREPAQRGAGGAGGSALLQEKQGRVVPPVLRETDLRDGSVQFTSHHTTHCAVTFQNSLLYELD
ncbi:protein kintoun [Hemicordylus capensis]|uniref:protein kintoun n=1 Tax=Hemicordylus capensis TaxID=884348 RepID=UPI00230496C2|nr:protein kintoun [Hemicordylus capensis]